MPSTRNDLIDMINEKKSVIVISNELITQVYAELNKENNNAKKSGGTLKKAGVVAGIWALFFSTHPVGWLIGGIVAISAGAFKKLKKALNHYKTYQGKDLTNNDIYVMMYEDVDLKLDTISYPTFVQNVNTSKLVTKIKI